MTKAEAAYIKSRQLRMAEMVEKTERKLAGLYREANRYKMSEILKQPCVVNEAWDREGLLAKIEGGRDAS